MPGGRSGSYRSQGRASCWIQALEDSTAHPAVPNSSSGHKGAWGKWDFPANFASNFRFTNPSQLIPTLEVLNSSWELPKSVLGSNMEFSGTGFQRNTEKNQPNPPKRKNQTTQSTRIRKILFPALAAFLVGTNRISAGFGSLDPLRKLKLLDFGPSLTLEHNKYTNKAFFRSNLQINQTAQEKWSAQGMEPQGRSKDGKPLLPKTLEFWAL